MMVITVITDFSDTADTTKRSAQQHREPDCLKGAISKEKVLGSKKQMTQEKLDQASNETINKTCVKYKQRELNKKVEKMGRALGKYVISLCLTGISQVVKIGDVKAYRE